MKTLVKKIIFLSIPVFALFLVAGCGSTAKFIYPDNIRNLVRLQETPIHNLTIAVLPFDDSRANDNSSSTMYLYLVPLVPYGWICYQRPDAARNFLSIDAYNFTASEDLAKAAAMSLRRSNLFKTAFFTFGGEAVKADYVLTGNIIFTEYKGREFSYGLSIFGEIFWFFGAPAGTSTNKLALTFMLKDNTDRVIWEYTSEKSDYIVQWIYAGMGYDAKMYAPLMEQIMNEAVLDLSKKMQNKR